MSRRRFPPSTYAAIRERQDNRCAVCEAELIDGLTEFDHHHAICFGGPDEADNLRALCRLCHRDKTRTDAKGRAKMKRIRFRKGLLKKRQNRRARRLKAIREWKESP